MTGIYNRIGIRGRDGMQPRDHRAAGPRIYIGMTVAGVPNMFALTGPLRTIAFNNMLPYVRHSAERVTDATEATKHVQMFSITSNASTTRRVATRPSDT